ncbi:MAG: type II toxin-antitoxin system RelE/ParE family toxin [Phycisphaerae bacterium]
MAEYTVTFAKSAQKEFRNLDSAVVSRIYPKIEALRLTPVRLAAPSCTDKLISGGYAWGTIA